MDDRRPAGLDLSPRSPDLARRDADAAGVALELIRGDTPTAHREFDDGTIVLDTRAYDHLTGRLEAVWTFVRSDGTRSSLAHSLRAYTPVELVSMRASAGLELEEAWGGWDGSRLGEGHRTLLHARRPA